MGCCPTLSQQPISSVNPHGEIGKHLHVESSTSRRIKKMSNPLNTIETELKKSAHQAGDWISSTARAAEAAYHDAEEGVGDLIDRGNGIYQNARKRVSRKADDVGVILHDNAYSAILIGIGVGTLLGYLLVRRNRE
jgi:ElaB/YqjD/DUF883 family membrane-anchored ribosome-binding protein